MPFKVGLDLGQSADYTALSVVQALKVPTGGGNFGTSLHLRHLERYPLRTPYPEIAERVAALMRDPLLSPEELDPARRRVFRAAPELVVDNTGVGVAVTDLLRKLGLKFVSVTITGGDRANGAGRTMRVPKRDLVASLEVPFHTGTLKVAEGLDLWPALKGELLNFRRKINLKTAHDSYEHWRETDHDDLVLATALACWQATRRRPNTKLRLYR
ncbi:MAG: hypothetical protein CYG60_04155 [Actinobacteria bacterium]|nr:MAG: hypothetical protein CYG60_04155 [Actinomycetota bacterium]